MQNDTDQTQDKSVVSLVHPLLTTWMECTIKSSNLDLAR